MNTTMEHFEDEEVMIPEVMTSPPKGMESDYARDTSYIKNEKPPSYMNNSNYMDKEKPTTTLYRNKDERKSIQSKNESNSDLKKTSYGDFKVSSGRRQQNEKLNTIEQLSMQVGVTKIQKLAGVT